MATSGPAVSSAGGQADPSGTGRSVRNGATTGPRRPRAVVVDVVLEIAQHMLTPSDRSVRAEEST